MSTPPSQYRTAYANAVLRGRTDIVALLTALGASTELSAGDRAVAALARGERPDGQLPDRLDADSQEVIILGSLSGQLERVVDALGPNFFGHVGGGPPGTLLHHAAWVGDPRIVERLIERGADPVSIRRRYDRPVAWASLNRHHARCGRDYVAAVEDLVAAGAELKQRFAEVAHGPLAEWLDRETSPDGEQSTMP
jgi:hypothetical protein